MAKTGFMFAEEGLLHDTGAQHPECPARLSAIQEAFDKAGLNPPRIAASRARRGDLKLIHTTEHIDTVERTCAENGRYPDADTVMMDKSWDAALLAAGSAIAACQAVLSGEYTNVFNAMRPPGHHAERDKAMGFCLFNNVAIAAKWLREAADLNRIAIIDWDVHHGNGTQHSFIDDATVFYASMHQWPHYPGTGRPDERGKGDANLNIPMAAETPAKVWVEALRKVIVPAVEEFAPDFLLISCGFDAHRLDPLSNQNLEAEHYAEMTHIVKGLANGRVVSLLEGGYHLDALGQSAVAHFKALAG